MTLSLDTAYRSFGGEVEASSTPTICRLSDSRRHQLSAIARPHFRRRFVPKRTTRETASTARIGPLRDPGAKPCCTIAEPRAGVHIINRQQCQHGPCHVTNIAAHLISIF